MSGGEVLRTVMLRPAPERKPAPASKPVAPAKPDAPPRRENDAGEGRAPAAATPPPKPAVPPAASPPPEAPIPAAPPVDVEQLKTIDVRQISDSQRAELTKMWGGAASAGEPPQESSPFSPAAVGATVDFSTEKTVHEQRAVNRQSTLVIPPRAVAHPDTSRPDDAPSDYELLGVIGKGGVGVVYSARQASIHRTVAVKMLRPEFRDDADQRDKFLAEAVVTGDLDHPNIVPIHDLGADASDALFYVMKRVKGRPWSEKLDAFTLRENLDVLLKASDAIAFAHSRGVIHRDIKPENIMLGDYGEVLVMDWGIAVGTAQFEKSEVITQSNAMGGTPAYMSPEMATGPLSAIGPTSDVYLLGAVLFEIINGRPPHHGRTVTDCISAASRNEIVPHRSSGELSEIAACAMATDQSERYCNVPEFQAAVRGYLAHAESVQLAERGDSLLEEAQQDDDYELYARSVFAFVEAYELWDLNQAAIDGAARAKLAYARCALSKGDLDLAASQLNDRNPAHAPLIAEIEAERREQALKHRSIALLKRAAVVLTALLVVVMVVAAAWILRAKNDAEVAIKLAEGAETRAEEASQKAAAANELVATADEKIQSAERRRTEIEQQSSELESQVDGLAKAATFTTYLSNISYASSQLADNGFAGARTALAACPPDLRAWEWRRLQHVCFQGTPLISLTDASCVSVSADGVLGAVADSDGNLYLLDLAGGRRIDFAATTGQWNQILLVAQGDQRWLVAGGADPASPLQVWSVGPEGFVEPSRSLLDAPERTVTAIAASASGEAIFYGCQDGAVAAIRLSDGAAIHPEVRRHEGAVHAVAAAPQGDLALSAGADGRVLVYPSTAFADPVAFREHVGDVFAVCFSPDGRWAASAGADGRLLVWEPRGVQAFPYDAALGGEEAVGELRPEFVSATGHESAIRSLAVGAGVAGDPAGSWRLASGGYDKRVILWRLEDGKSSAGPRIEELKTLRGHSQTVLAIADLGDDRLLSAGADGRVVAWDVAEYSEYFRLPAGGAVAAVAVSPAGDRVATASSDGVVRVYDGATGDLRHELSEGHDYLVSSVLAFADGTKLLTAGGDRSARVWNVATGTELARIAGATFLGVTAISEDQRWIAVGAEESGDGPDGAGPSWTGVLLYDGSTNELRQRLANDGRPVGATAISADNALLYVGDADSGRGTLWRRDGQGRYASVRTMRTQYDGVTAARFLADGRLATLSLDGSIAVWATPLADENSPADVIRLPGPATGGAFDAAGRRALAACTLVRGESVDQPQCFLAYVDFAQGRVAASCQFAAPLLTAVRFNGDGTQAVVADVHDDLWKWDLASDTPQPLWARRSKRTMTADLAILPSGDLVTAGGRRVHFWNQTSGEEVQRIGPLGALTAIAFSASGDQLAVSDAAGLLKLWDLSGDEAKAVQVLGGGAPTEPALRVGFLGGDQTIVAACRDGALRTWDSATGALLGEFALFSSQPVGMEFAGDEALLVTGAGGEAVIWSAESREVTRRLNTPNRDVRATALSDDHSQMAIALSGGGVALWNVIEDRPAEIAELKGKPVAAALAFVPGEPRLAVAGRDGVVSLWETERAGDGVFALTGHSDELRGVVFSPDGRFMATASRDGSAILWPADATDGAPRQVARRPGVDSGSFFAASAPAR